MNQKRMRAALQGKAPGVAAEKILWASGYGTVVGPVSYTHLTLPTICSV